LKLFIIILTTLLVFIRAEDDLKGSSQSKEDKLIENIEEDLESQNQEAFDNMLNGLYPLTPEQILSIRDRYEDTLRAKQSTSMSPPKPTISSQFVKLSPGSTPPIVRLLEGFVSSVVFLDSTGAVWPIESYNVGDPNSFNLQWNGKDNIIVIQAKTLFKYGNLIVRLEGLDTPVVVTLIPGQKEVDYRRELRISGYGPNSNAGNNNQDATVENRVLLDGIKRF
jgi:intracellular multiplication protein IcmK